MNDPDEVTAPKDIGKRWEDGDAHHPKSVELFDAIAHVSWEHCDDAFQWKKGGDGDNGEAMMFILDFAIDLGLVSPEGVDEVKELTGLVRDLALMQFGDDANDWSIEEIRAVVDCPFGDPRHAHLDGCPSCDHRDFTPRDY